MSNMQLELRRFGNHHMGIELRTPCGKRLAVKVGNDKTIGEVVNLFEERIAADEKKEVLA